MDGSPSPSPPTAPVDADADWAAHSAADRDRVEPALRAAMAATADRLVAIDEELAPIGRELVEYVATGGKRLRPLLVLLGHRLAGGNPDDVVGPAVAVEMLHTWALIHDDVIDADETRRGRPTTHRGFATRHRDNGWGGDSERYGAAMAILVGDLVAILADESFERATVGVDELAAGREAFSHLRVEVTAGQVLDVHVAAARTTDLDRALRVATLKSGRYSVTRPLQLGALLAGADDGLVDHLREIGDRLGVAFQLRDDLLGVVGDPDRTGKAMGGDLREGKRTVLVAEAMARLDPAAADRLELALGDVALDDATIAMLVGDLDACGAVDAVQARVEDLVATAEADLRALPPGQARDALAALATTLTGRTR